MAIYLMIDISTFATNWLLTDVQQLEPIDPALPDKYT